MSVHAAVEILFGMEGDHTFLNNSHHLTMLSFFLANAGADLVTFYRLPTPPDLDYLTAGLSFAAEAFLFSQHIHGRSMLDKTAPTLLYYPVAAAAVLVAVETVRRDSWLGTCLNIEELFL